ncbi:MAG: DUF1573 domain-containing protein, partial [Muribaculaceae bacterium]|nr:DUF1573 domain-containing protein [Muribaculaceae bacterium]
YIDVAVSPETVAPGEHTSFVFYFRSDKCPLYGFVSDTIRIVTDGVDGCPLPITAVVREDFSRLTDKQMKKSPIAHIAEPTIDFGRLDAPTATRTARIKNIGKSTLELRRVYTADPGIKVEVDRMSVKPGKEATVTITVDRSQLRGAILNARISVIANDPMSPVQNIRAVGTL